MSEHRHLHAIQALRIFAASPDQIADLCRNPPKIGGEFFFPGIHMSRYLAGVGGVFITYKGNLYDYAPASAAPMISAVAGELQSLADVYSARRWSLQAVGSSPNWHRLRASARALLAEVGESPPAPPTLINVEALINVREFYTPRHIRKLLRDLGLS